MASLTTRKSLKLYESLTNQQRAVLAFDALINDNREEADRIADSVELRDYRQKHTDFLTPLDSLELLIALIEAERWKTQSYLNQLDALLSEQYFFNSTKEEKLTPTEQKLKEQIENNNERLNNLFNAYYKRLNALKLAIVEMCERIALPVKTLSDLYELKLDKISLEKLNSNLVCEEWLTNYRTAINNKLKRARLI